jgi:hypothetical protein
LKKEAKNVHALRLRTDGVLAFIVKPTEGNKSFLLLFFKKEDSFLIALRPPR